MSAPVQQRRLGDCRHLAEKFAQFDALFQPARCEKIGQRQRGKRDLTLDVLYELLDPRGCRTRLLLLQPAKGLPLLGEEEVHVEHAARDQRDAHQRGEVRDVLDKQATRKRHSTIRSARTISSWGTVIPSAFAVRRLIASSGVGCCSTGSSPGLAPRRIRSM